ncbi:MAG: hypothetical protein V3U80_05025 [Flavobacteriaceae bacterium]
MGNSSPTTLMLTGMLIAFMSIKLKEQYLYISYIVILVGLIVFILGIIKYYQQRKY